MVRAHTVENSQGQGGPGGKGCFSGVTVCVSSPSSLNLCPSFCVYQRETWHRMHCSASWACLCTVLRLQLGQVLPLLLPGAPPTRAKHHRLVSPKKRSQSPARKTMRMITMTTSRRRPPLCVQPAQLMISQLLQLLPRANRGRKPRLQLQLARHEQTGCAWFALQAAWW